MDLLNSTLDIDEENISRLKQPMGLLPEMKRDKKDVVLEGEFKSSFLAYTEEDSGDLVFWSLQNQISGRSGECGVMEVKEKESFKKEGLVK